MVGLGWVAALGTVVYYASNELQDLAAHWGIGLGAKGKEMVAKYKAVGATVGELTDEATLSVPR